MITIKLSYPSGWNNDWGGPMFLKETPSGNGVWGDYKFEINNDVEECDYWIVYEDIDKYLTETAICAPENVLFITGEVVPFWNYPERFIRQFGGVITARKDIQHPRIFQERHTCVWHVKKNYDFLKSLPPPQKNKNLSTITSDAVGLEGHKSRYALVNKLKGHFKDNLDWYGKGEKPVNDKWDGLIDYRYSIAIENFVHPGYFTEKILDCYLAYTLPVYFGCPDVLNFFDPDAIILLEPKDYKKSISIIEDAIADGIYEKKLGKVIKLRERILDQLSFFPFITSWLSKHPALNAKKKKIALMSREYFNEPKTMKQRLYRTKLRALHYLGGYT